MKRKASSTAVAGGSGVANGHAEVNNNDVKRRKVDALHTVSGIVLAMGEGETGQLGLGEDILEKTKPAKVPGMEDIVQVSCGGMHTLCLSTKGHVFSFGCNDSGALGRDADNGDDCKPGRVPLNDRIVHITAGDSHSAALTDQGKVFVWGTFRDSNGDIGLIHPNRNELRPVPLDLNKRAIQIASGADHIVILVEGGTIYTCGVCEHGQLGRVAEYFGNRGGRRGLDWILKPCPVMLSKKSVLFTKIWAGSWTTFAKDSDNNIYAWGLNNYYQLGIPPTYLPDDAQPKLSWFVPEKISAFARDQEWKEISSGQHHTLALNKRGQVYVIGRKEYGRLGLGADIQVTTLPTLIPALQNIQCKQVSAGPSVSLALTEKGQVYIWGMSSKQIGLGDDDDDQWEPVLLTGNQIKDREVLMIATGGQHSVLLAAINSS